MSKEGKSRASQFIDLETLQWIKENKPVFQFDKINNGDFNYKKIIFYIDKFYPNKNWFAGKEIINSVHGGRHMMRVLAYTVLISTYLKLGGREIYKLCLASAIHDLRRLNDNADIGHGERAAEWFMKNKVEIFNFFKLKMTSRDIEEIYFIIFFHAQNAQDISNDPSYIKYQNNINIFKTADALDRYRFPKLKWWIDDRQLTFKAPIFCKEFSYKLVLISEEFFLANRNNKNCLRQALMRVCK